MTSTTPTTTGSDVQPPVRGWLPGSNLAIFAYAAAWGLSLHLAAERDWWASPIHAAVTLAAAAVMVRPNSLPALTALSIAWVGVWVDEAPRAFNHTNLFAVLLIAVPVVLVPAVLRPGSRSPAELADRLFPYFRALLYLLFGFAVLHKLNDDYFEPALSCGVDHMERIIDRAPILPSTDLDSIGYLFIAGSLLIELSIPICLSMRRLRTAGLVIAFAFHYLIGFNSLWSFSGPAVALYVAFLPPDTWQRLSDRLSRNLRLRQALVALTAAMLAIPVIGALSASVGSRLGLAVYIVWGPLLMGLLVADSMGRHGRLVGRIRWWQWGLVALTLLVGLSPYLGLGTRANFAMFSNLQTEGPEWNHLFMPEAMQVFDHQDRLIVLQDGTGAEILELVDTSGDHMSTTDATGPDRIVEFEFVRAANDLCATDPGPVPVTFVVDGARVELDDVCASPEWSGSHTFPLDRVLRFRIVSTPSICRQ